MDEESNVPSNRFNNQEQMDTKKEPDKKHDKDWRFEFLALTGFCGSGLFFVASSLRSGDLLSFLGSITWIISCLLWMIPYKKYMVRSSENR